MPYTQEDFMGDLIKLTVKNKRLQMESLREATVEDFAPVGDINSAGCALAFITLIADDTPWDFKRSDTKHTVTLKISFGEGPQIKKQLDEWEQKGEFIADPCVLSYLMDLWKAHLVTLGINVTKGKSDQAMEKLKAMAKDKEALLYKLAVDKFNHAVKMLQAYTKMPFGMNFTNT
jgi:hypothetical protein